MENREIKFRAWDSKNKIMHIQLDEVDESRTVFWKTWENTSHISEPMQFIGLKDKNRKDIYEGDIVYSKEMKGVVKFSPQLSGWYIEYQQDPFRGIFTRRFNCTFGDGENYLDETIEVTGNIYQKLNSGSSKE